MQEQADTVKADNNLPSTSQKLYESGTEIACTNYNQLYVCLTCDCRVILYQDMSGKSRQVRLSKLGFIMITF